MVRKVHIFSLAMAGSLVLAGGITPLLAQSLADVARKEEARRKEIKKPAKIYTNKDLGAVPSTPTPPPAPSPTTGSTADAGKAADKDAKDGTPKAGTATAGDKVKDQAYWAGRLTELNAQLEREQTYADAMQSRINALTTDFTARDDPAQRAVIARDRQKALEELDRLKKAVQSDKQAIADLHEEARRAGVPPGWLR